MSHKSHIKSKEYINLLHGHSPTNLAHIRQLAESRPAVFVRCAKDLENLHDLVGLSFTRKQRLAGEHFCENTAHRPHVHGGGVRALAQQQFRRAICTIVLIRIYVIISCEMRHTIDHCR